VGDSIVMTGADRGAGPGAEPGQRWDVALSFARPSHPKSVLRGWPGRQPWTALWVPWGGVMTDNSAELWDVCHEPASQDEGELISAVGAAANSPGLAILHVHPDCRQYILEAEQ
jgi:hypothetical protein